MARVVFANGSKQMAHNLDDLWERWVLKREAMAIEGIDTFIRPPTPNHNTTDMAKAFDLKRQAVERIAALARAKFELRRHHDPNVSKARRKDRLDVIEYETLYWVQVKIRVTPLAKTYHDLQNSIEQARNKEYVSDNEVINALRNTLLKRKIHAARLDAYCSYLLTLLLDCGVVPENFDQWTVSQGLRSNLPPSLATSDTARAADGSAEATEGGE